MELDKQIKLKAASTFLLQSPPGEINDVLDDIRNIILDDDLLEISILDALESYNFREFIVANLNGENVLITESSKLKGKNIIKENRILDPKSSTSFLFDHMKITTSSPQPFPTDVETESLRKGLENLFHPYVKNHYSDGVSAVYALVDENYPEPEDEEEEVVEEDKGVEEVEEGEKREEQEKMEVDNPTLAESTPATEEREEVVSEVVPVPVPEVEVEAAPESESIVVDELEPEKEKIEEEIPAEVEVPTVPVVKVPKVTTIHPIQSRIFGLYLVGNKYNPTNFWTGRWKGFYKVNYHDNTLVGTVQINCHYYEQGNVQLSTTLSSSTSFPSSATPTQILAIIKQMERSKQIKISNIYNTLAEESFKSLRRALPKTRSKIDWDKISGYRLGGELGGVGKN